MKLHLAIVNILFVHYLIRFVNAKGLTMITRGCIRSHLQRNQLLNASISIGPVPREALCTDVLKTIEKNVINEAVDDQTERYEEFDGIEDYKECLRSFINKNSLTNFLIKSFMYQEEKAGGSSHLKSITSEIMSTFDYLCYKNKLDDDFTQKFPSFFATFEKESNRICLINLLRQREVIDVDFQIEFDTTDDTSAINCPEFINEDFLNVKTASHLIHQSLLYKNEEIWKCAIEVRTKLGYVTAYHRLVAYTISHETDDRKDEERQKFLNILRQANENVIQCFINGYEYL